MSSTDRPPPDRPASKNPLSLERLRNAFTQMLTPAGDSTTAESTAEAPPGDPPADEAVSLPAILEGVLFVAAEGGRPRPAKQLAAALRDISPQEVDQTIADLNEQYRREGAPYHIEASPAGYRLQLDEDLGRLRDKFYGRVREAKLTPAALEVLSVIAYRQPTTATNIDELRGARSNSLLTNLVRRGLVRVDRSEEQAAKPLYRTTQRFLKLFGIDDLEQLPRAAELE